jgi:pullulanase
MAPAPLGSQRPRQPHGSVQQRIRREARSSPPLAAVANPSLQAEHPMKSQSACLRWCRYFLAILIVAALPTFAHAAHTSSPASVALVGNLQSEIGCAGDWQPECPATELTNGGDFWLATFLVPAGNWEYKVALNDSWAENYGLNGQQDGPNIPLVIAQPTEVTFFYDPETHAVGDDAPLVQPAAVTLAGSFQSELGCPGDWQPDCSATGLVFDEGEGIWQREFALPAGQWEYKAALNGTWDENYGRGAERNGSNITLDLPAGGVVKFYYDHATHWITDNRNSVIATLPGSFQSELGCSSDWDPSCLRTWLQDPDGDGLYTFTTSKLPVGTYEVKVAINESWAENYGEGGVPGGPNLSFAVAQEGALVVFTYNAATHLLSIGGSGPAGNLTEAKAHWLTRDTVAWNVPGASSVQLHFSPDAQLAITPEGLVGGTAIELTQVGIVDGAIAQKFRHLAGLPVWRIQPADIPRVPQILKQQIAVAARDAEDKPVDATGLQAAGVLDDLFTYPGPLGVTFAGATPSIRVWAPTAQSVKLHLFDSADASAAAQVIEMTEDAAAGTWSVTGSPNWNRKYYLFEVTVYVRTTGRIERNLVTDPYSLSLSKNSQRSQIVNLDDSDLKPRGWDRLKKPKLESPLDIAIYELHVRDFSISDERVPAAWRGTFKAFTQQNSHGMRHLQRWAAAGGTHVHLLPAFDIATINEDRSRHETTPDLSGYPPDSDQQQAAVSAIRGADGFNWGYDPYHYTAPEGSYATDPNGVARIREFREMVAALDQIKLRVIMDVVYNHTSGSGQGSTSVLDRIVPGYYHRLNSTGGIEMSSCCANTATEHNMMEKLMLDSLRTWATAYKVDGFRFDLMGHHTKANIVKAQSMLHDLRPDSDGVEGRDLYLYGEGWDFGEVANNARFEQATQGNMAGTGVGTFNDRIRDAVRGGAPFDSGIEHVIRQGFVNGLYTDPNAENTGSPAERAELLALADRIRVSLAGNLTDYTFTDRFGNRARGADLGGYASNPQESVNYVEAHDNETLFDINQYKLPRATSRADRVRVQNLATSIAALAQGVPFFHAGQDTLRSKSMDRNSYDAGDWFNVLDFTYNVNGWGRGVPLAGENQSNWDLMRPLLADPAHAVGRSEIERAVQHMREMLAIRRSSELFRLRTAAEIQERVVFHNTGPDQIPGLIVMSLRGQKGIKIVVLFNADVDAHSFTLGDAGTHTFVLHPILASSDDPIVRTAAYDRQTGTFRVPARTTAVFVGK